MAIRLAPSLDIPADANAIRRDVAMLDESTVDSLLVHYANTPGLVW
jgi:hypothetical protein